jgi:hypothetical protein
MSGPATNRSVTAPLGMRHPLVTRRSALSAGCVGLLGLGMNHLEALRAAEPPRGGAADHPPPKAKSVIYIFLSGGLAQHDSFDLKPEATDTIRGDFKPIATRTTGVLICEHLPLLAQRSDKWALVRSLTHPSNDHSLGHHIMLTGRSEAPRGFDPNRPQTSDYPSIAAVAGDAVPSRLALPAGALRPANNLPPAVVLPERLVHYSGRVIPGQFAGMMGPRRDPWFVEASPYESTAYGAYPQYEFDHQQRSLPVKKRVFQAPNLSLPEGLGGGRVGRRIDLLKLVEQQRRELERFAEIESFDRYRQQAVSLLADPKTQRAFDVVHADAKSLDRYGRNAFGWSLLMARRLVSAGVSLVQVNLGNNESWDTHGNAFPHLRDKLFPPTDRALAALLDDLDESGELGETLIVMAGEFGRTPKISTLPQFYKLPGRDHWGAVQTVFFAGGGVRGGTVIGSSDKTGGYPHTRPQRPENMAATIYHALGIPSTAVWRDDLDRPHHIYDGEPISGLLG